MKHSLFFIVLLLLIAFYPLDVFTQPLEYTEKLNDQVMFLYQQGKYQDAIPLAKRVLTIREKNLGPEHHEVANILNNLAALYYVIGNYDQAEVHYKRALTISEKALGPEHHDVATCLNNLSQLYSTLGDYTKVEALLHRALNILKKELGPEHPNVATCLINLASLYTDIGDYSKSESYNKRALTILEKTLGPDHHEVATCLSNLAQLYHSLGDHAQAEPFIKRALAIKEKVLHPEHPQLAVTLNNLGQFYSDIGDYAQAEPLFKRALVIYERSIGPEHPSVAQCLNNLALLYKYLGDYSKAELLLRKAIAIWKNTIIPDHPSVSKSINNLAGVLIEGGKLEEAYSLFKKQGSSMGLGKYYLVKGDYFKAEKEFQRSLQESKYTWDLKSIIVDYTGLGLSYEGQGRYQEAKECFATSIELIEEQYADISLSSRQHFLSGEAGIGFSRLTPFDGMIRLIIKEKKEGYEKEALLFAEGIKSRTFLEQLAAKGVKGKVRKDEEILEKDRKFQQDIIALKKRISVLKNLGSKAPGVEMEKAAAELEKVLSSYETFLREVKLENTELASLISVGVTPVERIQSLLDPDTSVIEYYTTRDKTYAWLITEAKTNVYEISKGIYSLEEKVNNFLIPNISDNPRRPKPIITLATDGTYKKETSKQEREKNRKQFYQVAHDFYKLIIAPIVDDIKTDKLIIVPHGVLHKVPFAALNDGTQHLVDRYNLSVLPASSVIEYVVKKRNPNNRKLLAFANPTTDYVPLGFSEIEVDNISSLFPKKEIYAKSKATEGMAKEKSSDPDVIHFACHGEFNERQPLQSGLLLAKDRDNDGYLQVHEIFGLNLENANLVTLSACETALGKIQGGDDMVGLSRGFIYAGTPSILATLWSVDDRSTSILMKNFYKNWQVKGMSKPEALRQAQITLKSNPDYQHPYYWAAFEMIGDWR